MSLPSRIGKYEVRSRIGQGGMGVVYSARDPDLDRIVAIKLISGFDSSSPHYEEALARFRRESRAAAMLSHPNVVNVYELGRTAESEGGAPFLVMELIDGKSLEQIVTDSKAHLPVDALRVMSQIAEALDYAHSSGIVHRDVKPANILIRRDGVVKLTDFGIARIVNDQVTRTGMVMGTPAYMSPEQIRGERMDWRSDQFSFGVVAWLMLSEGTLPFDGPTDFSLMQQITASQPAPLKAKNTTYPAAVEQALLRALSKKPDDRFPTCKDFFQALETAFQNKAAAAATVVEPVPAPPVSSRVRATPTPVTPAPVISAPSEPPPVARKTPRRLGLIFIVAAAALAVGIYITTSSNNTANNNPVRGGAPASESKDTTPAAPQGVMAAPQQLPVTDVAAKMNSAEGYFQRKEYATAEDIYRGVVQAEPGNVAALRALASTLYREDKMEESAAILDRLPKGGPGARQETTPPPTKPVTPGPVQNARATPASSLDASLGTVGARIPKEDSSARQEPAPPPTKPVTPGPVQSAKATPASSLDTSLGTVGGQKPAPQAPANDNGASSQDSSLTTIGAANASSKKTDSDQGPKNLAGNVMTAKLISAPPPPYPPLAKIARQQGIVKFSATIGKDGKVADLKFISGPPLLIQAATDAVKTWIYQPTYLNGEPVAVLTTIDVNFVLKPAQSTPR